MTLTVTPSGRKVVSSVTQVPGPRAREAATKLLGEDVEFVRGTSSTDAPGLRGADAEARGIQYVGNESIGARQASTHYACQFCEARQKEAGVINVTGVERDHGRITRK